MFVTERAYVDFLEHEKNAESVKPIDKDEKTPDEEQNHASNGSTTKTETKGEVTLDSKTGIEH